MPDPSHRPYEPMNIIRPDSMPRYWWLFPWSYAKLYYQSTSATRALLDRQDDALKLQAHIIVDQSEEIADLRLRVRDLDEAIIRGSALIRDAKEVQP